ncbi:virion protein [Yersinia phage vB_YenP_Rambo]|uniref:Virion protein n=1 Tax=Yersinia phage vB_YenP_Rambo TaxID=2880894 RepID=A0AC61TP77_9CAUD|nr:virion protein [Yersinia phage vB_YenP_Rambo]
MCFSPKIKTPQIEPRAVEPAPLTQEVTGVEFGGESDTDKEETEVSGRKSLKVERDDSVAKSKAAMSGNGSSRMKSAIRKSAFGGKR